MKLTTVVISVLIISALYLLISQNNLNPLKQSVQKSNPTPSVSEVTADKDLPKVETIAQNLDTPWAIEFLPDGRILVSERKGAVRIVETDGNLNSNPIIISGVKEIGEGGLLGITLHPNFSQNNFVYLYYTYEGGNNTKNRVSRFSFKNNSLINEEVIVDNIPGASNHNGGRIKFGPDELLYITTGDAQQPSQSQNINSLAGKILRVTDDGKIPPNNPFSNAIYSFGHRNPQGIDWDLNGNLWSTEHGRSGVQSGLDELNLIVSGSNYGWPDIEGNETATGMITPVKNSGNTTWAPAGASFIGNSLFFGGLRGNTLYEAVVSGNSVTSVKEHFKSEFGRIREVIKGPDGMLYITTSNNDGRGIPKPLDDKIIRVNPTLL